MALILYHYLAVNCLKKLKTQMLQVKNIQRIWSSTAIKGCSVTISAPVMNTDKGERNDDAINGGVTCTW